MLVNIKDIINRELRKELGKHLENNISEHIRFSFQFWISVPYWNSKKREWGLGSSNPVLSSRHLIPGIYRPWLPKKDQENKLLETLEKPFPLFYTTTGSLLAIFNSDEGIEDYKNWLEKGLPGAPYRPSKSKMRKKIREKFEKLKKLFNNLKAIERIEKEMYGYKKIPLYSYAVPIKVYGQVIGILWYALSEDFIKEICKSEEAEKKLKEKLYEIFEDISHTIGEPYYMGLNLKHLQDSIEFYVNLENPIEYFINACLIFWRPAVLHVKVGTQTKCIGYYNEYGEWVTEPADKLQDIKIHIAKFDKHYRYLHRNLDESCQIELSHDNFSITLYFWKQLNPLERLTIENAWERIIKPLWNTAINKLTKSYAISSAMASIMARNMSHNIGSHVLSDIVFFGLPEDNVYLKRSFFRYLQERMEFIALVVTGLLKWSVPAYFCSHIMRNFYEQTILLDRICKSEGLKIHIWKEEGKKGEIIIKTAIKKKGGKLNWYGGDSRECPQEDFRVAVPGGTIGFHAFYIIFENVLRNAAKHDYIKYKDQGASLSLNVKIEEDNEGREIYWVTVWTEIEVNEKKCSVSEKTRDDINERLKKSFIKGMAGNLSMENWGLQEMKICAGYLQHRDIAEIGKGGEIIIKIENNGDNGLPQGIIKAILVDGNGEEIDGEKFLGYKFWIRKPKEGIVLEEVWERIWNAKRR